MTNPFTLAFGMEPKEYITRQQQMNEVITSFESGSPSNYMYMLSGIRGSGKTVMLSSLSGYFEKKRKWIVINVSPDMDILQSIAANLYSRKALSRLFREARIDLSALGIGLSIKNSEPVYDISTALEQLFSELERKGIKTLIAIDEIVNNANVKLFAGIYQILLRKKCPVFLLMTGLYENINNLQNEKTLTFLYRAPKIYLEPLNLFSIALSYKKIFDLDDNRSKAMAELTNGYAYAYQVLGYLYWEKRKKASGDGFDFLMDDYDSTLSEYVYEKIWFELPDTEKKIVSLLIKNGQMKVKDIKESLSLTDSKMSVYRDRLKRRGIIDVSRFGYLSLALPRFKEIVSFWMD